MFQVANVAKTPASFEATKTIVKTKKSSTDSRRALWADELEAQTGKGKPLRTNRKEQGGDGARRRQAGTSPERNSASSSAVAMRCHDGDGVRFERELKSGRAKQSEVRLEDTLATLISTQPLSAIKN